MTIPKIVHFIWLDKDPKKNKIPPKRFRYINTWKTHNPEFQFMYWFNSDIEKLISRPEIPQEILGLWKHLEHIEKCDVLRYIIIFLYGGIYSDLNVMCYRNLSPLLNRDLGLVLEPPEFWKKFNYNILISNSILFSSKLNPFWYDLLVNIYHTYPHVSLTQFEAVLNNTGPIKMGFFVNKYFTRDNLQNIILDTCQVLPYSRDGITLLCNNDDDKYLAKIWRDSSFWGKQKGGEFEHFLKSSLSLYQPDEIFHQGCDFLLIVLIVCLAFLLFIILIKSFLMKKSSCKLRQSCKIKK